MHLVPILPLVGVFAWVCLGRLLGRTLAVLGAGGWRQAVAWPGAAGLTLGPLLFSAYGPAATGPDPALVLSHLAAALVAAAALGAGTHLPGRLALAAATLAALALPVAPGYARTLLPVQPVAVTAARLERLPGQPYGLQVVLTVTPPVGGTYLAEAPRLWQRKGGGPWQELPFAAPPGDRLEAVALAAGRPHQFHYRYRWAGSGDPLGSITLSWRASHGWGMARLDWRGHPDLPLSGHPTLVDDRWDFVPAHLPLVN